MHIKTIEPIAVSLPMLKPVIMAGEEVRRADNVLVRIEADNGLVGWGEAASAPVMTGDTLESIVAAVHYLAPALRGREAADIAGALAAMDGRMYGNHGAKAAIEIALHDLAGRAAGKPVHALLGEKKRSRLPLLGVVGSGDLDGDLRDAEKKKAAGFTAYKIKVGIDTAGERRRPHARDLQGAGRRPADFLRRQPGLQHRAGHRLCARGERLRPRFLRAAGRRRGISPAWRRSPRPRRQIAIGADEGIHSLADIARHHERKAARGVSLKAIKLGGIRAVVEAGRLCDRLGMSVNISCKTGEFEHRLRGGAACRERHPQYRLGR